VGNKQAMIDWTFGMRGGGTLDASEGGSSGRRVVAVRRGSGQLKQMTGQPFVLFLFTPISFTARSRSSCCVDLPPFSCMLCWLEESSA
jgi:hypothetical protein